VKRQFLRFCWVGLVVGVFASSTTIASHLVAPQATTSLRLEIEKKGEVIILLHTKEAPKATSQVIRIAQEGFYNGQRVHEVMADPQPFLVKLGDPLSRSSLTDSRLGSGGSGSTVPYEDSGKSNRIGAVGLATRERDPDSGDSIFYIMLRDAPFLDGSYTVFGQVTKGMEVVRRLEVGDKVTSATVIRG
jgi:cyclophilin family peptidyl-prolyl cis-trans isomerase